MNGSLEGIYICEKDKSVLVDLIAEVRTMYSVPIKFCCQRLDLHVKRYQRWVRNYRNTGCYANGKPGPDKPPHRLLAEEREKIIQVAKDNKYADLSHRQLAVVASEEGIVEGGASSFYRVMKKHKLIEKRQRKIKTPQQKPEVKPQGPNEIWSWDLTYIPLGPIFVYLFAIIDVYSRKIVGWHLALNARIPSMKKAWDIALANEGLLEVAGAPKMPTALSDHGIQMAKKTARQFFKDLGIKQLFARYKTPSDNGWIESWFRILKYDWLRYKDYVSFAKLHRIITEFINVYNTQRYHGAIGYVTPEQKHSGKAKEILRARAERKRIACLHRLEQNRQQTN